MPVEIREIIIRTEILSSQQKKTGMDSKELKAWKKQLLEECSKMIADNKRITHKR